MTADELRAVVHVYLQRHPDERSDLQPVPARPDKDEPVHFHHDFEYAFITAGEVLAPQLAEVADAR